MKGKKASMAWEEIGKWILVLALVVVLLVVIGSITGVGNKMWDGLANLFRFGK